MVHAAQVVGELLCRGHSQWNLPSLVFLGWDIDFIGPWDACLSSRKEGYRVSAVVGLAFFIIRKFVQFFWPIISHCFLRVGPAYGYYVGEAWIPKKQATRCKVTGVIAYSTKNWLNKWYQRRETRSRTRIWWQLSQMLDSLFQKWSWSSFEATKWRAQSVRDSVVSSTALGLGQSIVRFITVAGCWLTPSLCPVLFGSPRVIPPGRWCMVNLLVSSVPNDFENSNE